MSESILEALIRLFSLIIDIHQEKEITDTEKNIVRSFLARQLNSEMTEKYMLVFDDYLDLYHKNDVQRDSVKDRKRTSLTSMRILGICEEINKELEQKQKIYVFIQLIEFISFNEKFTEKELEFLEAVASAFNIPQDEFKSILNFIIHPVDEIGEKSRVLVVDQHETCKYTDIKHICNKQLAGEIFFLNIPSTGTLIMRFKGKDDLYLNSQNILPGLSYAFEYGSSVRNSRIDTVYYSDISGQFSETGPGSKISMHAHNVNFRFKNSENGIQDFSFYEEYGKLIGIIGGSGVGKSTLLNVLNGNLQPQSGEVLINGYNVHDKNEKKTLEGVIGFVPQDDLLIEELTVYQNLYYNARLCLNSLSEKETEEAVDAVMNDLDLQQISGLKVGSPVNKVISGGQRKRVNIALELIREPSVLFVDEPTSGLSSVDSEAVMNLLKEQSNKGKLVIVNIHQPSSDLYKMFDKIIILDKGGYQIYYGNPNEAIVYFKTVSSHVNPDEDQCGTCGTINPDQVLQIIEAKVVNEHGKPTRIRKVSPVEWFEMFRNNIAKKQEIKSVKEEIPVNNFCIPGIFNQLRIFFKRDLLSKLTDKQFVLISLLEAPLLAVILGFLTKYISGTAERQNEYIFANNENLPAYLFMSVVVALFLGMIISAEEIIGDRKILQRESFLNLSRFSYLNSKILILILISAIQTISYVLIGNFILEIQGMTLSYWLVLFSISVFANILGLNISSGFNSVITIYIVIPFLLIPQMLLGGVIIKFDKLHKNLTSYEYVPAIGDLMASRWAYEALAVEQFKNNQFEKSLFALDQEISNSTYNATFLIPALLNRLSSVEINSRTGENPERTSGNINLLNEHIGELVLQTPALTDNNPGKLDISTINESALQDTRNFLESAAAVYSRKKNESMSRWDEEIAKLDDRLGGRAAVLQFQYDHHNTSLADLVENRSELDKTIEYKNRIIRKYEPVYMSPASRTGRAHFYAHLKKIGNWTIDTLWFNIMAIWAMSIVLYLALYYDLIRKTIELLEGFRIRTT